MLSILEISNVSKNQQVKIIVFVSCVFFEDVINVSFIARVLRDCLHATAFKRQKIGIVSFNLNLNLVCMRIWRYFGGVLFVVKEYKKSTAFSFVHAMFRFCGSCLHFARLYFKQQTTKVSDNLHFGLPRTFLYRRFVL